MGTRASGAILLIALSLLLAPSSPRAQAPSQPAHLLSGRDLATFCSGKIDVDYGFCAGYVTAIAELMLDYDIYGLRACNHGPVRSQQLMEIVKMSQAGRGSAMDGAASLAVASALADSFPCR